jgi:polyhydroxyalkanoate synthase subunit PhaC
MALSLENSLVHAGELEVLGTPVDLSQITCDTYVVAGIADHITPWQNAYRSTQLLGSEPRFVLSTSGHIAAMVNPPGNPKASFQTHTENPPEAEAWLAAASKQPGTWWTDWSAWLGDRSGGTVPAREDLGGRGHEPVEPAPGSYVFER